MHACSVTPPAEVLPQRPSPLPPLLAHEGGFRLSCTAFAPPAVRPLTKEETKVVFEKLHKFIGKNIKALVDRGGEQPYCLRLQKNRVFYVREDIMRRATNVREPGAGLAAAVLDGPA